VNPITNIDMVAPVFLAGFSKSIASLSTMILKKLGISALIKKIRARRQRRENAVRNEGSHYTQTHRKGSQVYTFSRIVENQETKVYINHRPSQYGITHPHQGIAAALPVPPLISLDPLGRTTIDEM
jgi:hypothetical protein